MQVGNESVPSDLLESPGTSEESSADEQSSVESSEDISVAAPEDTSEELSESAVPEDLSTFEELSESAVPEDSSETQVEYITETGSDVTYISTYNKDDLAGIQTRLEVIICLLFVLVIYIVVKICRSILEILGF